MKSILFLMFVQVLFSFELYEDFDSRTGITSKDLEFEPIVTINKDKEKTLMSRNLNCDDFSKYARNCTMEAAFIYNSSRRSPPMPAKMSDWCRAIRLLTNCAIDWNSECKDVTESHFNEESIKGHMHVVNNVCDDEWFLSRYADLPACIERVTSLWEACYTTFKTTVDRHKNETQEWTHYVTHFLLCCARTKFRRCTLNALFDSPSKCDRDHAITLQNYSVIISEGDVFQNCNFNMIYSNCPGGDPRPSARMLSKLMSGDVSNKANELKHLTLLYHVALFINKAIL